MRSWLAVAAISTSSVAQAEPTALERTALAILEQQLVGIRTPHGFVATLAPDAIILGNGSFALAGGPNGDAVADTLAPRPILQTFVTRFAVGSSRDAIWFDADVSMLAGGVCDVDGCNGSSERMLEFVVTDGGSWHVVAVAFTSTSGLNGPGDELGRPGNGPLMTDVASSHALEAALRDDASTAVVIAPAFGIGTVAHGRDDSRRSLAAIHERRIAISRAIEVHGAGWGFATADLAIGPDPHGTASAETPGRALVIAIRDRQRWSVVAVQLTTALAHDRAVPIIDLPYQLKTIAP